MDNKYKEIGVIYDFSRIDSIGSGELAFNHAISLLEFGGKQVETADNDIVVFDDGSRVKKLDIRAGLQSERFTHLFVSEDIYDLANGEEYFEKMLMNAVIPEGEYTNLDVKGSRRDRIITFN